MYVLSTLNKQVVELGNKKKNSCNFYIHNAYKLCVV